MEHEVGDKVCTALDGRSSNEERETDSTGNHHVVHVDESYTPETFPRSEVTVSWMLRLVGQSHHRSGAVLLLVGLPLCVLQTTCTGALGAALHTPQSTYLQYHVTGAELYAHCVS